MKNINETKNKHIVLKLLAIFMISITVLVAGAFMNKKVVIDGEAFCENIFDTFVLKDDSVSFYYWIVLRLSSHTIY